MPPGLSSPGRPGRRRLSWRRGDSSGPGAERDRHDRHHRLRDGQPPERAEGPGERGPRGRDHLGPRPGAGTPRRWSCPASAPSPTRSPSCAGPASARRFATRSRAGKPCLGVCLGLQLLFDVSEEDGQHEGLGLLPGRVVRFESSPGLKIPHMGWNTLRVLRPTPLLAGLGPDPSVYFVHSYYAAPTDPTTSSPSPTTRTRSRRSSSATT